jgi:hypothetical protein
MRRFRPAGLSSLALLEGDQKSDLLFTDLGLRDDLQAGLTAAQGAVKRIPGLPVLYTTGQVLTNGMCAMFVEQPSLLLRAQRPRVPHRCAGGRDLDPSPRWRRASKATSRGRQPVATVRCRSTLM